MSFRGRSLLRLAQSTMSFRAVGEESHISLKNVIQKAKPDESHAREKARPVRDISHSLNMTQ